MNITEELFILADASYKNFNSKLLPTVDSDLIIGVRIPQIRSLAAKICGTDEARKFLSDLPHRYLEEYHLHSFLISRNKDFYSTLEYIETLLPYIDNWAVCDSLSPKAFAKASESEREILRQKALEWMKSDKEFTVRFGVSVLMKYFLGEWHEVCLDDAVADLRSEKYYVKMMCAWYFATALSIRFDETLKYLTELRLDTETHNKTIQKAIESYRITADQKQLLRSLRIKKEVSNG